jgi:hypothetical protein
MSEQNCFVSWVGILFSIGIFDLYQVGYIVLTISCLLPHEFKVETFQWNASKGCAQATSIQMDAIVYSASRLPTWRSMYMILPGRSPASLSCSTIWLALLSSSTCSSMNQCSMTWEA